MRTTDGIPQHLVTSKTLLRKAAKDKNLRKWFIQNARLLRNEHGTYLYFSAKVILATYKEKISLIEGATAERERKELIRDYNYTNTINKKTEFGKIPNSVHSSL